MGMLGVWGNKTPTFREEIGGLPPNRKTFLARAELVAVGSVRSESTPAETDTSVTDLPKGKGQLLGWKGSGAVAEAGSLGFS